MNLLKIRSVLINLLPTAVRIFLKRVFTFIPSIYDSCYFHFVRLKYIGILRRIRKKKKYKVAFFLIHKAVWKCEGIYRLMEQDERFDPVVVVCPLIIYVKETMIREMDQSFKNFSEKGYNVIKTYNNITKEWLDIKKDIKPDIVFFTNPHPLTKDEYYIANFSKTLTCYVPYTFQVSNLYGSQYNRLFHNLLWKAFYQTSIHKEIAINHARNRGMNVIVTGYPGIDIFLDKTYLPVDKWKIKNRNVKRIIWAPHHTIGNDATKLKYSNFLKYHQDMLDIAKNFIGRIQIAFKPHPLLKSKLFLENDWGEEKANEYYHMWNNLANGQLEESDYSDLFLTSDAMIHDSASFMAEYLAVNKPVLYNVHDDNLTERFNVFGKMAFEQHYHAHSTTDIIAFIENIVINENDIMKNQRESFFMKYMITPDSISASSNIFKKILEEL